MERALGLACGDTAPRVPFTTRFVAASNCVNRVCKPRLTLRPMLALVAIAAAAPSLYVDDVAEFVDMAADVRRVRAFDHDAAQVLGTRVAQHDAAVVAEL